MKPQTKKLLSISILVILIALAVYYGIENYENFKELTFANSYLIWFLIPLVLLNILVTGFMNTEALKPLGLNLRSWNVFQLANVTSFYNFITPFRGGMGVRAVYLKKKHNFSYSNFFATLAASFILIFLVASIFGIRKNSFPSASLSILPPFRSMNCFANLRLTLANSGKL